VFDDRRLAAAFLGMTASLSSRPEPRQKWDNVAAGRATYKGHDAVVCAQEAMRDAILTGDMVKIDETAQQVAHFFEELKHVALRGYFAITNGDVSLDTARLRAIKEANEAVQAIAASWVVLENTELTAKELDEAIAHFQQLRARLASPLINPSSVSIRRGELSLA
jgi:hypothetical protein